jgi:hypothetical protein
VLFHVKHIHTFETCPAGHGPEMISKTFVTIARPEHAKEAGVKVLGMYADAPAHITYFILDADSAEKVGKFLLPILLIGTAQITPITDLAEEVKRKIEESKKK